MKVFLVDGTYELFRQYFGRPGHLTKDLQEVGALRGVLTSTLALIEQGARYIGVATDHVIESNRNHLYAGYKTGEGVEPELLAQFTPLEEALVAMGVVTWPMVEWEADDALASAAVAAAADDRVEQVAILTPDKDLAQVVSGGRVVQVDRRNNVVVDAAGVVEKFGVPPESIADYLALVGDSADGYPGLPGWGAKSTAAVLSAYGSIEQVPVDFSAWTVKVRGGATLAATLAERHADALLFKDLATLRTGLQLFDDVEALRWQGPTPEFDAVCAAIEAPRLAERAARAWEDVLAEG